jgi:hypothetical protein
MRTKLSLLVVLAALLAPVPASAEAAAPKKCGHYKGPRR